MMLKLCLQPPHEVGQPDLAFAFEPFRRKNPAQFAQGRRFITIDDDIVVFPPMAHLVGGLGHPRTDDGLAVLRTALEASLQLRGSRWQNEDADKISALILAQLLRALPVDIKQNVAARLQSLDYWPSWRAVPISEYFRPFQKFALCDHSIEARAINKMIITAANLARALGPRGHRYRKLDHTVRSQQQA